jgi:hypothetical protein
MLRMGLRRREERRERDELEKKIERVTKEDGK